MKNIRWTILAALLLAAPTAVQAQAPGAPTGPPPGVTGAPGAPTTPTDTGAVTNAAVDSTTTTTTTTSSPGIGMDEVAITDETMTTELANTGGEPLILSLMGLSMAAGAFFLRRRVTG